MEETNKSSVDSMEVKEEDQQNQPPKQIKTEETKDRISSLPDCLIIDEILSRLDYTKEVIRTGTLSKRWQHLWPSIPTLIFQHNNEYRTDFYLSVDKTLTQCRHRRLKNLNKFHVWCHYESQFESQVNHWIRFAINSNVQQLYLLLSIDEGGDEFALKDEDDSFFINSCFTFLHLAACMLNPTGSISWNNLTHLTISDSKLQEHLIANILSGCPLLDTLTLGDCYGYSWLDITSKSVKNLVLCGYAAQDDEFDNLNHIIEINAPYISSLTIEGYFLLWKILLRDVTSLVKADLDYTKLGHDETTRKEEREEMLKRFILGLRHVKELKIGIDCLTAFSRLEAEGFIFPSNLKVAEVTYPLYDTDSTELGDSSDNDSSVGDESSGSVLVT